jgi:hypothetical protein
MLVSDSQKAVGASRYIIHKFVCNSGEVGVFCQLGVVTQPLPPRRNDRHPQVEFRILNKQQVNL